MPLNRQQAIDQAQVLIDQQTADRGVLDQIRLYWRGRQKLPAVIPDSAPREVRVMAVMSRVNVIQLVIETQAQSLFVEGFRTADDNGRPTNENAAVWQTWQANKLDARQTGVHRAALAYGTAYSVVLPGDRAPVIRGASPRRMTAVYGEDPDWPMWALERHPMGLYRLYDAEAVYFLSRKDDRLEFVETREHPLGVTPVVRFSDTEDLDLEEDAAPRAWLGDLETTPAHGQVGPLMPIQDQIDMTTFGLLVAQWYSAFRQRWAIGWTAEDENERIKAAASQLWTFDEDPENMKLGEFSQTDLKGYIESREASLRHAATLSQTPAHELIGELVNLSAEALAAAEAGRDRKVDERKTLFGESWEQVFWLAGRLSQANIPEDSQVVWRDTSARAFAATVDALGKLSQMLGVPPQELWERVPGATQQDVERWKAAFESGDAFAELERLLERQAAEPEG